MVFQQLTLGVVEGTFAVCRLEPSAAIPHWATASSFFSITRTVDEISIVCADEAVPVGIKCERGWKCLRVAGTIEFSVVGVLTSLTAPLAEAGVSIFALSTFDTDYLMIKDRDLLTAICVLRHAGHVAQIEE